MLISFPVRLLLNREREKMIFVFNFNFKGFSMYLFKDFILSINYGPTNGCGSHLCDVSPAPSPSLSLHLFAPSLSTLGVSIFIPLCIFTYFLARNIKVASIVLLPNIVWLPLLLSLPGSGGCMGEAVWVCVCQTVAARLSFTVSSALCACVCVRLCVCVIARALVLFVCVCIWFSFTYEAP